MSLISPPPRRTPPRSAAPARPAAPPPRSPPQRGSVKRLLLGCLIALLCSAGAGAVFVLDQVHSLREALKQNRALSLPSGTLAAAGWGDPQTLLLVGDDQRALTKYYHRAVLPHANEMLLVRIDPSKPYISMMSVPRELEVTITPRGQAPTTTRLNFAYTAGGIPLLVSTIKRVLNVSVNHVMVSTFGQFKRAVDQMGCVYSTIDRRYFHRNVPGGEQYQEIDLQPGYQNLCGPQSLQFVSYRHGDTSLVRDSRDQSFLLDVKAQYGGSLASSVGKFERIFGQAVRTDSGLQSSSGLLNLIGTLISSSGRRVRQVHFQANLVAPGATPCACVTASPQQISDSVNAFLRGGSSLPKRQVAATAHAIHGGGRAVSVLPLVATPADAVSQARDAGGRMPFPLQFPRVQDRGGVGTPVAVRPYVIHGPDGTGYPIYAAVFASGQLGQYYDVQGTTWKDPPLLANPDQTIDVGGRTLYLKYQSDHLETVAWHEHGAVYWVRNTLTGAVPDGELLAIAEQTRSVGGGGRPRVRLRAALPPARPPSSNRTGLRETIGLVAGVLTLLATPLLLIPLIRRRRELGELRAELHGQRQAVARVGGALRHSGRGGQAVRRAPR